MLISTNIKAQLPVNDISWHLDTSLSDEFNGSSINLAKWDTCYKYWWLDSLHNTWHTSNVANGAEWDFGSNLIMTDSSLIIIADTLIPNRYQPWGTFPDYSYGTTGSALTYAYQGGVIVSKNPSYKFGYVEMFAKFPSHKWPLWLGGWLQWSYRDTITPSNSYYNEIDFAENGGEISYNGYQVGNNWWVSDTSYLPGDDHGLRGSNTVNVLPPTDSLSGGFHKFAIQWDPYKMIYYFDDNPTTTVYDSSGVKIPQHGMKLFMNFCVDPMYAFLPNDWTGVNHGNQLPTRWPQSFEINYVHYYKLGTDCNTNLTITTPSDYDRKVDKTITTSNATFSSTNITNSYTLRATDIVTLGAGTYINPSGTGYFAIETMGCPQ